MILSGRELEIAGISPAAYLFLFLLHCAPFITDVITVYRETIESSFFQLPTADSSLESVIINAVKFHVTLSPIDVWNMQIGHFLRVPCGHLG